MTKRFSRFYFLSFTLATFLLTALAIPFCVKVGAQENTAERIAIVDIQRVLINSKAGKRARESLEKEFKNKQKILDEKSLQYENLENDFAKSLSIMNEETLSEKSRALEQKKKDLLRAKEDFSDDLTRKQEEMKREIFSQIQSVVNEFGKSEGYSLILANTNAGVIFISQNVDVTEKIISLYDQKY